uniref:Uncharacterized protein n=1 Tax=Tanacetum cinerariifolium TaxID=118510 RepID=A0A699RJB5_TANCI|nr:hypothetical protein [Tanacetum cinerariifolium]
MESKHPEQSESVPDTYPIDQDVHNVIIDSLDMSYDREEIDQNDDNNDIANEGMPTKIGLTLEQSQQGVSNDVLVRIEGVEETH